MPARVRKTVPHFGPKPHREHRSKKGRTQDYKYKRGQSQHWAMREKQWSRQEKRRLDKLARESGG